MKLQDIFFKTKSGVIEYEMLHNLDEYSKELSEFSEAFAEESKGKPINVFKFCEYVISKGLEKNNEFICIPQSYSIDGKLIAIYTECTETSIQIQYNTQNDKMKKDIEKSKAASS